MNNYQNEKMIIWAGQNFPKIVEIKKFDIWILCIILITPFFGISALLIADGIYLGSGTKFFSGLILLVPWLFIFVYFFNLRQRTVIYMDSNEVKTRGGKTHQWSNLSHIDLAPNAVRLNSGVYSSSDKFYRMELIFEDGKAIMPQVLELTKTLEDAPVQVFDRRGQWW